MTKPFPKWHPHPASTDGWRCELLVEGEVDGPNKGHVLASLEVASYACYPAALNPKNGQWERGGAYARENEADAVAWAERVAGMHPLKEGDDRPPFYFESQCHRRLVNSDSEYMCVRCSMRVPANGRYRRPEACLDNERRVGPDPQRLRS